METMYYKIVCSRESEMTGAGLGYVEIFGHESRYFRTRKEAIKQAHRLNHWPCDDDLNGTYSVQERNDGDDAGDENCREQLAPPVDCRFSVVYYLYPSPPAPSLPRPSPGPAGHKSL
jgi:hypothetical protein